MKKIMILGAGVFQLPLIRKAKSHGYTVVGVSPRGAYVGLDQIDIHIECDTRDISDIVNAARKHSISAVLTTGTDVAIPALAAVAEDMGLVGPSVHSASTASSKSNFRELQKSIGLYAPEYCSCHCFHDLSTFIASIGEKIVVKPDDSSGSRGVSVLESDTTDSALLEAYNVAKSNSKSGIVCAESFLVGVEVGGEAFFVDKELVFFTTTTKHMDGVLVLGHTVPGIISADMKTKLKDDIIAISRALQYNDGPMNFDAIVSGNDVSVLEVGLRNGGNGITEIVERCYGVDLLQMLLENATGQSIAPVPSKEFVETSSFVFGSTKRGILTSISSVEYVKSKVPEVISITMAKSVGSRVNEMKSNADLIGYLILDCGADHYMSVLADIYSSLEIRVS
jgi:biotin carboxylase